MFIVLAYIYRDSFAYILYRISEHLILCGMIFTPSLILRHICLMIWISISFMVYVLNHKSGIFLSILFYGLRIRSSMWMFHNSCCIFFRVFLRANLYIAFSYTLLVGRELEKSMHHLVVSAWLIESSASYINVHVVVNMLIFIA